jgi:predicted TIM-barrel fold metal-dependent hydrolase
MDRKGWLVSADNHFVEPEDLWTTRLPKQMRERAPRYVLEDGVLRGLVDGQPRQVMEATAFGMELHPPDLSDIGGRLEMLERDGIWSEGVLGNLCGVVVMCLEEPDFALACARAYNDWMAEVFEPYRDRVVGHAYIPMCGEPAAAVAEVERAASLGLRSIIIPLWPPEPYLQRKFDPVWEAAAAHDMPICMHAHTGRWFRRMAWGDIAEPEVISSADYSDPRDLTAWQTAGGFISFPQQGYQCYRVAGWFIGSGALERHPNLQLVFVECGAAWLLSAAEWLDDVWRPVPGADRAEGTAMAPLLTMEWPYPLQPSDYLRRQIHVTFQDEPTAIKFRHQIGVENLMWGSDVPHNEGTWPHTREVTERVFAGVSDAERSAITRENFTSLFRIPLPA